MPITWKNVDRGSNLDSVRLLENANEGINSAFTGLTGIMKDNQQLQEKNRLTMRGNNTQTLMDALQGYDSVEAFNAAKQSGAINKLRQDVGGNYDRAAFSSAVAAMPGQLMERANKANAYNEQQLMREVNPLVQQHDALVLANDDVGAAALREQHKDLFTEGGVYANMMRTSMGQDRTEFEQQRGDTAHTLGVTNDAADRAYLLDQRARTIAGQTEEDATKNRGIAIQSLLNTASENFLDQDRNQAEQYDYIAHMFGMPNKENGNIDWESATADGSDLVDRFTSTINDARLVGGVSSLTTSAANNFASQLMEAYPNIGETELTAAVDAFNSRIGRQTSLSAPDQARYEAAQTTLATDSGIASNPAYVYANVEPTQASLDAVTTAKSLVPEGVEIPVRHLALIKEAAEIGIDVSAAGEPPQYVKLYGPDLATALAQRGEDKWWRPDSSSNGFKDLLRDIAESDAIVQRDLAYTGYLNAADELKSTFETQAGIASETARQTADFDSGVRLNSRNKAARNEQALRAEQQTIIAEEVPTPQVNPTVSVDTEAEDYGVSGRTVQRDRPNNGGTSAADIADNRRQSQAYRIEGELEAMERIFDRMVPSRQKQEQAQKILEARQRLAALIGN